MLSVGELCSWGATQDDVGGSLSFLTDDNYTCCQFGQRNTCRVRVRRRAKLRDVVLRCASHSSTYIAVLSRWRTLVMAHFFQVITCNFRQ